VYAAIEKRAKSLASMPLVAQQRNAEGEWENRPGSRLQALLDQPNPDMDQADWVHHISQYLDISGNSYISEIRGGSAGLPIALWPLPSQHMRIKPGRERLVEYYEYAEIVAGRAPKIQPEDMIQVRMPNPDSPYFGMPPLMAAARPTDIDRESGIWQKISLENRGVSDVHIKLPSGATQDDVDRVREAYKKRQQGPKNARSPLISTGDVQRAELTAVELDFVASRKAVWSELLAAFGVNLAVLGFTEDVNLANAKAMRKMFWQDTVLPQGNLIERQLTSQLASEFGKDWRIRFDPSAVEALQEDEAEKLDNAEKLWRMGVPLNVINQHLELGLPEFDGMDIAYIGSGYLPTGWMDEPQDDLKTLESPEFKKLLASLSYGQVA
jgi:HK97 family phage portal protein